MLLAFKDVKGGVKFWFIIISEDTVAQWPRGGALASQSEGCDFDLR